MISRRRRCEGLDKSEYSLNQDLTILGKGTTAGQALLLWLAAAADFSRNIRRPKGLP